MVERMKRHFFPGLIVFFVYIFSIVSVVNAKPSSFCPLSGSGNNNCGKGDHIYHSLTPEKQTKCDAIITEFAKKTQQLREKMLAKKLELQAIAQSNSPERKDIRELAQEIAKLHTALTEEYNKMYEKLEKEVGIRGRHIAGSGVMCSHGICTNDDDERKTEESINQQAPTKGKKASSRKKAKNIN